MSSAETLRAFSPVVVFIDDGFAPVSLDRIDAEDWSSLRNTELSGWEDLQTKYSLASKSPMGLKRDEGELNSVWELYKENPQEFAILDPIFAKISAAYEIAIRPLREAIKCFKDDFELTVCCHSNILEAEDDISRSKLVFLDFYLYQQATSQRAIEDVGNFSSTLSSKVEVNGEKHNRFLFLISTNLPSSEDIECFRNAAKVKAAFFMPVSKYSLDQNWIQESLIKRLQRYNDLHHLASYLETFSEQMKGVMDNLRIDLEALELHDLAILDHMRLKVDGEDLGNYMSWLISETLAAKIRGSAPMLQASKDVSGVQSPPFHGMLSPNQVLFSWFSEITFSTSSLIGDKVNFGAVYREETPLGSTIDRETDNQSKEMRLKGGGICANIRRFSKSVRGAIGGNKELEEVVVPTDAFKISVENGLAPPVVEQTGSALILIIAPACDLQRMKCNYEVLCVRGAITKQTPKLVDLIGQRAFLGKDTASGVHKHLLKCMDGGEETYFLVEWFPNKITTIPASYFGNGSYSRLASLNELFCQEIKEEALRQVGRVGVPVDPAFRVGLGATIVYRLGKNNPVHIEIRESEIVSGLYISGNQNNTEKIILSEEFITKFSEEVHKIDSSFEDVRSKLSIACNELAEKGGEGFKLSKGKCKIAKNKFAIHYTNEFIRGSGEKGFCGVYFYPCGAIKDPSPESEVPS